MTHLTPLHDHPFAPEGGILLDEGAISAIRAALTGITLQGTRTTSLPWSDWVKTAFTHIHAPHLLRVHRAFQKEGPREAIALEKEYQQAWSPSEKEATASQEAGTHILQALPGAAHAKPLHKLANAVSQGETPGHIATTLGCHTAFFNVAPTQAAAALAFLEWRPTYQDDGKTPIETAFARAATDAHLGQAITTAIQQTLATPDEAHPFTAVA